MLMVSLADIFIGKKLLIFIVIYISVMFEKYAEMILWVIDPPLILT
tara:strand:- start:70578 stop:70715 length:138 start_codon:yes stop_codon:yes gene_type:complete